MLAKNKRLISILGLATALLVLPLVAMFFTNEVNWKTGDFIVAAVLLFGVGILVELILRKVKRMNHRFIFVFGLLLALMVLWIEMSVGIFGSPISGS